MSNFVISTTSNYGTKTLHFLPIAADESHVDTLPKVTLIWIYEGSDTETRRGVIDALDYPAFDVIAAHPEMGVRSLSELASSVPEESGICVFWADDGKPVSPHFLREMIQPLVAAGADMHLWSGNALAMFRATLHAVPEAEFVFRVDTFMKLTLIFLDASVGTSSTPERRAHVAFSSTERLAPICAEPVGMVS